jgi:hypothetical protein
MSDSDNLGRTRIEMTVKGTVGEAKLILKHLDGVTLEESPSMFLSRKSSKF